MRKLIPLLLAGLFSAAPAFAEESKAIVGDAAKGATKAAACGACHGASGISANPIWPNLAGQNASYIASQLAAFKSGERKEPTMQGMAAPLSEQDMADLGAHYAGLPGRVGSANPDLVETGEAMYRGGNMDSGVAACTACHGPQGKGVDSAGFPAISGQHAAYVSAQLKAFRAGKRGGETSAQALMMLDVAGKMTDAEIEAVSSYIEGLH